MTLLVMLAVLYSSSMQINDESNNDKRRVYLRAFHRIYRIDREITAETFPNAKILAELLNVHQRTVKRDLDFLRNELNAPLIYDYFKRGFRYKESGWTLPNGLLVRADTRLLAKRVSNTRKPRPERVNQWWGIDMTKVMTRDGWAYVVLVLDWYSKKVVGHYCGEQSKAWHWLAALNKAVMRQFPRGIREMETELNLMSDNGSQPTGRSFMETCSGLGIKQAFTAYNNPKGNADTERMMRTLKEELCWLREWSSAAELKTALDRFVEDFNDGYLHSALGYKTPNAFEKEHFEKQQETLNRAA